MPSVPIGLPTNAQLQSPLLRLPVELQHLIYGFCFAAGGPIVDPVIGCRKPEDEQVPQLGVALLQTCRRVYHEADRRPLFAHNTFRFTTVDRMRCFFVSLGEGHSAYVQDVEIDARRVHSDHPGIGREWLHYLAWGGGTWGKILGSLRMDAPGLKTLRLNFESWPSIPLFRSELWNLLRSMLLQVEGLERMVVIGSSKGSGMVKKEPWSPAHFVGGDDVGSNDLVQRMWTTVAAEDDRKVIRWNRGNGKLYLEVVSTSWLTQKVDQNWSGPCMRKKHTDSWPENGSCTKFAYDNRNSDVTEPTAKDINPSAAG